VPTPAWIGATPRQPQLAAQVNQFLGAHAVTYAYTGVEHDAQATAGSGGVDSNGLYVAQSFTAGGTYTAGRVVLTLALTGAPAGLSLTVQSNAPGSPSGTVLAGPIVVPPLMVPASAATVSVPLSWPVVSGSVYWIVAAAVGDASDFYAWSKSNQTSGASTSTNGTSWTPQTYGLLYQVWDSTAVLPLVHAVQDAGARWSSLTSNANNTVASIKEYTVAQGANQYVASARALTYSGTNLTSIA
jgi:hypothetical protein